MCLVPREEAQVVLTIGMRDVLMNLRKHHVLVMGTSNPVARPTYIWLTRHKPCKGVLKG